MPLGHSRLEGERELALMTPLSPLAEEIADARAGRLGSNDGGHAGTIERARAGANYLRRN
jgi:hypothetical protein